MKIKLFVALLVCAMGLGIAGLAGCKDDKKSNDASKLLPLLLLNNQQQQQSFFPEIPKGVAE